MSFIVVHTIHFSAVLRLAVLTAGENIRERDGWPIVIAVAAAFYLSAFGILRVWRGVGSARAVSHRDLLTAHVAVLFIAGIFVNSSTWSDCFQRTEHAPIHVAYQHEWRR